jgi:hypothetical protein
MKKFEDVSKEVREKVNSGFRITYRELKKLNPVTKSFTINTNDPNEAMAFYKQNYSIKKFEFIGIESLSVSSGIDVSQDEGKEDV